MLKIFIFFKPLLLSNYDILFITVNILQVAHVYHLNNKILIGTAVPVHVQSKRAKKNLFLFNVHEGSDNIIPQVRFLYIMFTLKLCIKFAR